jgi:hypothetical protein
MSADITGFINDSINYPQCGQPDWGIFFARSSASFLPQSTPVMALQVRLILLKKVIGTHAS